MPWFSALTILTSAAGGACLVFGRSTEGDPEIWQIAAGAFFAMSLLLAGCLWAAARRDIGACRSLALPTSVAAGFFVLLSLGWNWTHPSYLAASALAYAALLGWSGWRSVGQWRGRRQAVTPWLAACLVAPVFLTIVFAETWERISDRRSEMEMITYDLPVASAEAQAFGRESRRIINEWAETSIIRGRIVTLTGWGVVGASLLIGGVGAMQRKRAGRSPASDAAAASTLDPVQA